jgi:hypothetical protein
VAPRVQSARRGRPDDARRRDAGRRRRLRPRHRERSLLLFGGYRVVGPDGSKLASVSSDGSLLELFSLSTHWSYAVEGTDGQRLASIGHVRAEGEPAEQALSEVAVAIETGTVLPGGAAGRRLRNPGSARAVRKVAEPGSARRMPTFGFEQVGYSR